MDDRPAETDVEKLARLERELADLRSTALARITVPRRASVTAVNAAAGTVTLEVSESGQTASAVVRLDSYDPTVGDSVWALGGVDPLVVGWQADGVTQRTLPAGIGPVPYAGTVAPPGWLLCNGQAVSRTVYARLFAVVGTSHGAGNGSTTFNVQNGAGRVVVGVGTLGSDTYTRGQTVGAARHVLTQAELPNVSTGGGGGHAHGNTGAGSGGTTGVNVSAGAGETAAEGGTHVHGTAAVGDHTHALGGSGTAHENRQPSVAATFIVST